MYASPTEYQDSSSAQPSLTAADKDSAPADVDIRNPAPDFLGAGVTMGAPSSTLPRLDRRTVVARASTDGTVGTLFAAAPIIAKARVGCANPGLAPAIGYNIEGAPA